MDEWTLERRQDGEIQLTWINACFRDDLWGRDDNPYDDAYLSLGIDGAIRMRDRLNELIGSGNWISSVGHGMRAEAL
jgi:hypothetical protein